jgi:uncharacterized protein YfbU (UPF0304 family)
MIALLCDLHRKPDEREFRPENIKLIMSAITGGHDWAIDWEMGGLFPETPDNYDDVKFVSDVLDMWEFIELGWSKLQDADKDRIRAAVPYFTEPKFIGFDGNNETDYLAIARMLVEEMNRFSAFKGRSLNSHSPKIDRYRDMLTKWPGIRSTLHMGQMSVEQLIELLSRD